MKQLLSYDFKTLTHDIVLLGQATTRPDFGLDDEEEEEGTDPAATVQQVNEQLKQTTKKKWDAYVSRYVRG